MWLTTNVSQLSTRLWFRRYETGQSSWLSMFRVLTQQKVQVCQQRQPEDWVGQRDPDQRDEGHVASSPYVILRHRSKSYDHYIDANNGGKTKHVLKLNIPNEFQWKALFYDTTCLNYWLFSHRIMSHIPIRTSKIVNIRSVLTLFGV